jgi:hypothetical protein
MNDIMCQAVLGDGVKNVSSGVIRVVTKVSSDSRYMQLNNKNKWIYVDPRKFYLVKWDKSSESTRNWRFALPIRLESKEVVLPPHILEYAHVTYDDTSGD